jgi:hypothetical protein
MWPSIIFQPAQLAKSMIGARVWEKVTPLGDSERADYAESAAPLKGIPKEPLAGEYTDEPGSN